MIRTGHPDVPDSTHRAVPIVRPGTHVPASCATPEKDKNVPKDSVRVSVLESVLCCPASSVNA